MSAPMLRAAILVVSTTASRDPSSDAAGPALQSVFDADGDGKWSVAATRIVSDDEAQIKKQILAWTDPNSKAEEQVHLIVTTGGTGFAVSDITPEVVAALIEKPAPGLVHGMLAASLQVTPFAVMSRPVAGVRGRTVLVTLPGSPKGAKENLQAIIKMLPHACVLAAGMDSRALHAGGVKKLEKEAGVPVAAQTYSHAHGHDHGHGHSHGHNHGHSHRHSHGHDHGHGRGHGLVRHETPSDTPSTSRLVSNDPSLGPTRRNRTSPFPMISVDEALGRIEEFTPHYRCVERPVDEDLVGHVLAEDVYAAEDVPAFRASIVDGYAVVVPTTNDRQGTEKAEEPSGTFSGIFPVVAVSHAEPGDEGAARVLSEGETARITTGAPLPAGANAVVMVESTTLVSKTDDGTEEKDIEIRAANVHDGDNVREIGSDLRKGQVVMRKGDKITAAGGEVGLLISAGVPRVLVCRRPVVGVLSTGNEIVDHRTGLADRLRLGQVRDTNRPTLLLAAKAWGFETVDLGVAEDRPGELEQHLRDALRRVDLVVTTGGVSMGELDLLKPTIERTLGGTIHFGRVSMKPGKPTTFATVTVKEAAPSAPEAPATERNVRPIFSLPGNPASALVTFHLFVLPALHKMAGESTRGLPKVLVALSHDYVLDKERPEYHRAVVTVGAQDGVLRATSTGGQRSSKVGSMHTANALLCMPAGATLLKAGTKVYALLTDSIRSGE